LDIGRVKLPSIGWIRIKQSRPYPTGFEPKQFQIVRRASGYYLMITFQSLLIIFLSRISILNLGQKGYFANNLLIRELVVL
jgi:putative transposase